MVYQSKHCWLGIQCSWTQGDTLAFLSRWSIGHEGPTGGPGSALETPNSLQSCVLVSVLCSFVMQYRTVRAFLVRHNCQEGLCIIQVLHNNVPHSHGWPSRKHIYQPSMSFLSQYIYTCSQLQHSNIQAYQRNSSFAWEECYGKSAITLLKWGITPTITLSKWRSTLTKFQIWICVTTLSVNSTANTTKNSMQERAIKLSFNKNHTCFVNSGVCIWIQQHGEYDEERHGRVWSSYRLIKNQTCFVLLCVSRCIYGRPLRTASMKKHMLTFLIYV